MTRIVRLCQFCQILILNGQISMLLIAMGMFISAIAGLGTFAPDGNVTMLADESITRYAYNYHILQPALQGDDLYKSNIRVRNKQVIRLLG